MLVEKGGTVAGGLRDRKHTFSSFRDALAPKAMRVLDSVAKRLQRAIDEELREESSKVQFSSVFGGFLVQTFCSAPAHQAKSSTPRRLGLALPKICSLGKRRGFSCEGDHLQDG